MATATATRPTAKERAATVAKVTNRLTGTLGSTIDQAFDLREKKREAQKVVDKLDEEITALNEVLFERLDKEETSKGEGKKASVSIVQATVANVTDWDALWPYIAKHKHFHLIQKRVSDPGIRELWEGGKTIPGVQPFTKRTLNLRTLTK